MFFNLRKVKSYPTRTIPPAANLEYHRLYRFTAENVKFLAREFLEPHEETRGGALNNIQKMEITLRYLSDPGFQRSVGHGAGVTQSTVSKTLKTTLPRIVLRADRWIKFPTSDEEVQRTKEEWYQKLKFPMCVGAIDCTHVRIEKPNGNFGDEFINRKQFPSINVQATCNSNYVFTSVDCSWPGSVHDNRIFKNSDIYQTMAANNYKGTLLGDEGYGIAPFLMTPFPNPVVDPREKRYNKLHTQNRVVIEQCFGQLKRRFPILRYGVRLKLERVPTCIIACFILHNVAKSLNDPEDFEEDIEEVDNDPHVPREGEGAIRAQGQVRRHNFVEIISNLNLA